jgi:hypothetical protein
MQDDDERIELAHRLLVPFAATFITSRQDTILHMDQKHGQNRALGVSD